MPQGLQTFTENGNIFIDVTSSIQKFSGIIHCPPTATYGEVRNADLLQGTPWYFIVDVSDNLDIKRDTGVVKVLPTITISGDKLEWRFSNTHNECKIMYGVY